MNRSGLVIIKFLVFLVCFFMIIIGQRSVGKLDLGIMLIGLIGILALLYDYNRSCR